jgi:hypothetical protein
MLHLDLNKNNPNILLPTYNYICETNIYEKEQQIPPYIS